MGSELQPDLEMIGEALEDRSFEASWWFDPRSGEVIRVSAYFDESLEEYPG